MKNSNASHSPRSLASEILIFLIRVYQCTLSLEHGMLGYVIGYRSCRFFPSCSMYAIAALRHHGLLKGILVSVKRIVRCNPWCAAGYDPVQETI